MATLCLQLTFSASWIGLFCGIVWLFYDSWWMAVMKEEKGWPDMSMAEFDLVLGGSGNCNRFATLSHSMILFIRCYGFTMISIPCHASGCFMYHFDFHSFTLVYFFSITIKDLPRSDFINTSSDSKTLIRMLRGHGLPRGSRRLRVMPDCPII